MSGKNGVVAGIDIGTNNSCIAVYKFDKAEVLAGADGSRITPSVVYITETGEKHVGKSAKNYGHKKPERYFYNIKTFLGAKANDPIFKSNEKEWTFETKEDPKTGYYNYKVDENIITPEEIYAEVLKKLVSYVDEHIEGVVLTFPAYFSSEQKNKILEAAKIADLNVLQLVSEPVAAAIAYGMEHSYINGETLFVFDMGVKNLDITIIKVSNSKAFTIVALGGDSYFGGKDFDEIIIDWMLEQLKIQVGKIELTPRKKHKMTEMAKEAKEALSQAEDAVLQLSELHSDATDVILTRQRFDDLSKYLMKRIKICIVNTLKIRELNHQEINHVLFVGGASKMPMVSNLLKEFFNEAKFSKTVNAEEIVALGATRLAAKLGGQSTRSDITDLQILDEKSLMIGIEIFEEGETKFRKIFDSDSFSLGFKKETLTLVTTEDNQKKCEIPLYEGTSFDVSKNSHIGTIKVEDLLQGKAGEIKIKIDLQIDEKGILTVNFGEKNDCKVYYKTQFRAVNDRND